MNCPVHKIIPALALLMAMAGPLWAQDKINFSKPAAKAADDAADDSSDDTEKQPARPFLFIPGTRFDVHKPDSSAFRFGPEPRLPTVTPAQQQAWQQAWKKELERKGQWTLQTPKEIFGITTPQKILGLPDPNGEDKMSADEKFVRRQQKKYESLSQTNAALLAADKREKEKLAKDSESPFGRTPFESVFAPVENKDPQNPASPKLKPESAPQIKALFNAAFAPAQKAESIWGNAFNLPAVAASAAADQQLGAGHLRSAWAPASDNSKQVDAGHSLTPVPARKDPYMDELSPFNPHGNTFAPLKNNAERPHGLTPLPSIAARPIVTPKKSPTQPELPPWLREDAPKPAAPFSKF